MVSAVIWYDAPYITWERRANAIMMPDSVALVEEMSERFRSEGIPTSSHLKEVWALSISARVGLLRI